MNIMDMEYLMCRNSSGIQEISSVTREFQVQINRYDGEGLRHEMEENGRLIKFLYNEDREVVAEETGNGTITRYIRGLGIISSDSEEAKTYYHYVSDEQGSITHVLSEDAEILNHYSYDAFGNIIEKTEKVENRFCYNGEMLDPVTQQYYLRARFYNPVIGRFTQEDTYYGDGLNLYQYCQANPVGYVDPSGHTCEIVQNHYKQYQEYRKQHPEANAAEAYEAVTGKKGISSERHYDIKNGTKYEKITDYLKSKKQKYKGDKSMYSVKYNFGGDVVVSTKPIDLNSFSNTLDFYEQQGRNVVILSGTHGTPDGFSARSSYECYSSQFFYEDCTTASRYSNVVVYDVSKLTDSQFSNIINSSDVTICAWCWSERSIDVIKVIK